MKYSKLKEVKLGEKLYVTGNTKRRGQVGTVTYNSGNYVKLQFEDGTNDIYSHYVVQRQPIVTNPKKHSSKDRFLDDLYSLLKEEFEYVPTYKAVNIVDKLAEKGWQFRLMKGGSVDELRTN